MKMPRSTSSETAPTLEECQILVDNYLKSQNVPFASGSKLTRANLPVPTSYFEALSFAMYLSFDHANEIRAELEQVTGRSQLQKDELQSLCAASVAVFKCTVSHIVINGRGLTVEQKALHAADQNADFSHVIYIVEYPLGNHVEILLDEEQLRTIDEHVKERFIELARLEQRGSPSEEMVTVAERTIAAGQTVFKDSKLLPALRALADGYNEIKKFDECIQWSKRLLNSIDDAKLEGSTAKIKEMKMTLRIEANLTLGHALYYSRRYEEAIVPLTYVSKNDPDIDVETIFIVGNTHRELGQYELAIDVLKRALTVYQANRKSSVDFLFEIHICISRAYEAIGGDKNALLSAKKGLDIVQGTDTYLEWKANERIGHCHLSATDYKQASDSFENCVKLAELFLKNGKKLQEDPEVLLVKSFLRLANAKARSYKKSEAVRALQKVQEHKNVVELLQKDSNFCFSIAALYYAVGNFRLSLEYLNNVLQSESARSKSLLPKAVLLMNMGLSYRMLGNCEEALQKVEQSILLLEKEAENVQNEQLRYHFFSHYIRVMDIKQALLFDAGKIEECLYCAESSRCRTLSEALQKAHKTSPSITIEDVSISAISAIAKKLNATFVYYSAVGVDVLHDDSSTVRQQQQIFVWTIAESGIIAQKKLIHTEETERALSAVLSSLQSDSLAKFSEAVGSVFCIDTVESEKSEFEKTDAADRSASAREQTRHIGLPKSDVSKGSELLQPLSQLYDWLISCIETYLPSAEGSSVIIVPSNMLYLVPFPALYNKHTKQYLVEKCSLSVVPSLSTLITTLNKPQSFGTFDPKKALVIGNPQFMPLDLLFLPYAAVEICNVADRLGCESSTGDKATVNHALSKLPNCHIAHFATHGILAPQAQSSDKYLFGGLILQKGSGDDASGVLWAYDIAALNLNETKLVVLSACQTIPGPVNSEGVAGLARAFLAAGVAAVLATLWSVSDDSTKELMVTFYEHMLQGHDVKTALHKATLTLLRQHRNSPKRWAPFVLFGDPTVTIKKSK